MTGSSPPGHRRRPDNGIGRLAILSKSRCANFSFFSLFSTSPPVHLEFSRLGEGPFFAPPPFPERAQIVEAPFRCYSTLLFAYSFSSQSADVGYAGFPLSTAPSLDTHARSGRFIVIGPRSWPFPPLAEQCSSPPVPLRAFSR